MKYKISGMKWKTYVLSAAMAVTAIVGSMPISAAETDGAQQTVTASVATDAAAQTAEQEIVYAGDTAKNNHEVADASVVDTNAAEGWHKAKDIDADYACLMDANTGVVLYSKGKDIATPPASVTKIMTCLLALEKGDLNAQVTMTETGVAYATDGSSNLYTQVGEVFTLKDMLYGMMLKSANDMATQVGEYIGGGSIDAFAAMMNAKAKELGCRHTNFVNACGMPADNHVTTAYDMCLITAEAMKNPTFREIFSTAQYTIPATNMTEARTFQNHHEWILNPSAGVSGFIGGKTGFTDAALNTLVSVADRGGMELIAVVLHDNGKEKCLDDSAYLFRYGSLYFENAVYDNSQDLAEGGVLTVPKKTDLSKIKAQEKDVTDPVYGDCVKTQYYLGSKKVGSSLITKDALKAREEAAAQSRAEALAAESRAEALAAESRAEALAAESQAEVVVDVSAPTAGDAPIYAGYQEEREQVVLPLGIVMDRTMFLAIAILSGMILIGIISIIITVIVKKIRE